MRADSLGGRIVGAIARGTEAVSPAASAPPEPATWTEHESMPTPGRRLRLSRNSMLGRIVAAIARAETAQSATLAFQEVPTEGADLTILVAGRQPARKAIKATPVSAPRQRQEPVEPTPAARLRISLVPS